MWKDLIVNICAICDMCEDSHLNARGESFYGQHKMFEDIQDSIHDFPDEIQEIYFGARDLSFVPSSDVRTAEIGKLKPISEGKTGARVIKDLIIETLDLVKGLDADEDSTVGEKDLLSKIAGTLQQKLYFLQQFTK